MRYSKSWWALCTLALVIGAMVGELFAVLAGWPHRFLGELIGLVVLSVPFCVQHAIQKRKARSYARLLARVR